MADTPPHIRLVEDLGSELEEVRKFAVIGLSQCGDSGVLPHLERMTQDASPAVRYFARVGINKLHRATDSPRGAWELALDEAAADDVDLVQWRRALAAPDPAQRLEAALATARVVDPAIYVVLLDRLAAEDDARVRATLTRAISRFRRPESFEPLARLLADGDTRVRANAVEALEELGDSRLAPLLEPLLTDADNRTRGNALKALARFDRPRAVAGAQSMVSAPEVWMRATAIWLLRELGGDEAVRLLRQMWHKESPDLAQKAVTALEALAKGGNAAAVAALASREAAPGTTLSLLPAAAYDAGTVRRLLVSDSFRERIDAAQQAVKLPIETAREMLRERLGVEDHAFVIATLVKSLGHVAGEAEVRLLSGFLRHPDARVRANTVEGLAATGLPSIYPLLEPLLDDPNNRVRANAARVLAAKDSDRAFSTLKEMLLSADPLLAESALHALKQLETDQILEILEIGLQNRSQEIQLKVLKVLEVLGRGHPVARQLHEKYRERGASGPWLGESLPSLLLKMNDPDPAVRLASLEKLACFPESRARGRIRLAARDRDPRVRDRARSLLDETDLEERRRALFASLGLTAYKKMKADPSLLPDLSGFTERIKEASQRLDRGENLADSISLRRDQVQSLGERVFVLFQSGKVEDADLGEIGRQLVALEVERDNRRARANPPPPPSVLESLPPAFWAVAVLGVLLMTGAWLLSPGGSGPVLWRNARAPVAHLTATVEFVFAAQPGAKLAAYRKKSGALFWEASPGRKEVQQPVIAGDLVYLAADAGFLAAYRLDTGERVMSLQVPGQILAPPAIAPEAVYVLVSSPPAGVAILALEPRQGSLLRKDDLGPGDGRGLTLSGSAVIASVGDRVFALERATGKRLWEHRAEAPVLAGLIASGARTVFAAGKSVTALDSRGKVVWSHAPRDPEPIAAGPYAWGAHVVVLAGNRVVVLTVDSGAPVAGHEAPAQLSLTRLEGNRLLGMSARGTVWVLSLDTGRSVLLSGIQGEFFDLASDGAAVFVSTDRGLLALRVATE